MEYSNGSIAISGDLRHYESDRDPSPHRSVPVHHGLCLLESRQASGTSRDGFFDYLREIDCSDVEVDFISEGSVVFPKVPLMRVEGPVTLVQLLETPFVNLVNYASLVTSNAARHRHVAGKSSPCLNSGLDKHRAPMVVTMIDGRVIGNGEVGPVIKNAYKILTADSGVWIPVYVEA